MDVERERRDLEEPNGGEMGLINVYVSGTKVDRCKNERRKEGMSRTLTSKMRPCGWGS